MSNDPQHAELEEQILKHVNSENYQPVKARVIAKKLGFESTEERKVFRRILRGLSKGRKLIFAANHIVRPATAEKKDATVAGVFSRTSQGFGFVKPDVPNATQQDIFIAADDTKDAMQNDRVSVRVSNRGKASQKGPRGRIVEVLARGRIRFVGTLIDNMRSWAVRLDDKQFSRPTSVGDPGAKSAQAGDKVVVEFVRFPTTFDDGDAVIIEVLGAKGSPGVDTLTIIREFDLPGDFSEEVLDDARVQANKFAPEELDDRTDLRSHLTITIDPVDARDFDDAISLTQAENGHWNLGVHIADVAHFVPEGTALDKEAKARATSVYLPDRVIPMIPEMISNHLASLQPHEDRYAKTVWIEFSDSGMPIHTHVERSVIQSDFRFSYEDVDSLLADAEPWNSKADPEIVALVLRMHGLAMTLRQRRMKKGSLELHLPETKIDIDKEGKAVGAHLVEHTQSHQVIEEFMLAANEAVATYLADKELFFLRRIHAPPSHKKMLDLTQFARDLGFDCESLENRFELQRILNLSVNHPAKLALNLAVLRSMQKAVYSPEKEGHFALNSDNYCHFTSPIRRYPDLVIHRAFNDLIRGKRPKSDFTELKVLGEHCSTLEKRAEAAERELIKLKVLGLLAEQVGLEMDAVITGVEKYGLFAQGTDLAVDGFLALESLPNDRYFHDPASHILWGHHEANQFRLGDKIQVAIARVDTDRRELTFKLAGLASRPAVSLVAATERQEKTAESRDKERAAESRGGGRSGGGRSGGYSGGRSGSGGDRKPSAGRKTYGDKKKPYGTSENSDRSKSSEYKPKDATDSAAKPKGAKFGAKRKGGPGNSGPGKENRS
jgi:ribonuclease R